MRKLISKNALYAIEVLEKNGFSAYLVGGCVRDILMGIAPSDFDITTNALPEEIKRCFPKEKKILTGLKHGTVAPIINGRAIEITTYRIDGEYGDSRHPQKVTFTTELKEDLMRRDFTINAMAMDKNLNLFDHLSGKEDLEKGIIRCVGKADKRFSEDALRIMRALRFSARFGFRIEKETEKAIIKNRELLLNISKERIYEELKKLLMGKDMGRVVSSFKEVLYVVNPLLKKADMKFVGKMSAHLSVNFALLLSGLSKEEIKEFFKSLKADKETTNEVLSLAELSRKDFSGIKEIKYLLKDFPAELIKKAVEIKRLKEEIDDEKKEEIIDLIALAEKTCTKVSDLSVGGEDIKKLGFKGRNIGMVLSFLLDEVIEGKVKNERDALIECAKTQCK